MNATASFALANWKVLVNSEKFSNGKMRHCASIISIIYSLKRAIRLMPAFLP